MSWTLFHEAFCHKPLLLPIFAGALRNRLTCCVNKEQQDFNNWKLYWITNHQRRLGQPYYWRHYQRKEIHQNQPECARFTGITMDWNSTGFIRITWSCGH